ncbi:MAG: thiamine phosphate synthase [Treponema porcinum]|uniref:thiamine phosphate synthase n=2 Tax=Treponema porcinum TaxID=261392 RepID=UPI0023540701|nr:thiamine phosphate synthase [Treponema porcinum]MCI6481821.1 thiamine phosphate synthase [Treponema porcinum]MDY5121706.1 thiamine phosphate synthase [Treponema porcinum]
MNTLIAFSVAPFGAGEELSDAVAEVVQIIRNSGLKNRTYSMFTEIEGEWDDVMRVVKDATFVLAQKGLRTELVLKADIRPGYTNTMDGKLERLESSIKKNKKSGRCAQKDLTLYAITDRHWLNGETLKSQVEKALKGGATMIQIREKDLDEKAFLSEAEELLALCRSYGVPFIVNDNVELAVKIGADGVHVGQSDMNARDVRALIGNDKILGVSTQTVEQALFAQECGADYLGVGAVFPTGSKDDAEVLDRKTLMDICKAVSIPVVAIGGITKDNVRELKGTGIAGISVISAIFAQKDIQNATAELLKRTEEIL